MFFTSTDWMPELSRSRSLASRSIAVMTMTGMSRQAPSFCRAATSSKSVHFRHHEIEQDQVRPVALEARQRLATVRRLLHDPLLPLQPAAGALALVRIVVHQQDARRPRRRAKPLHQGAEPVAVDRLGEVAGGAERHAAALLVQDRDHDHREFPPARHPGAAPPAPTSRRGRAS